MQAEYQVIDKLPSNFRSYDFKTVSVRGLYFIESLSLARYLGTQTGDIDYPQLANIYADVIRLPNNHSIMELELVDFITLVSISSILSMENFSWNPNLPCSNQDCDYIIKTPITLDDLEFETPKINIIPDGVIRVGDLSLTPITLQDMVDKIVFKRNNEHPEINGIEIPKIILDYASLIHSDEDFKDKVRRIAFLNGSELRQVAEVKKDLEISLAPIVRECPVCHTKTSFILGLTQIRAYPST